MGRRRTATQAAAAGAVIALGAAAGAPAAFADGGVTEAWAVITAPGQINLAGSGPVAPYVTYSFADGGAEVPLPTNAKFVIDAGGLKGVATIKANHKDCTASGAVVTCLDDGGLRGPWEAFTLTPEPGAKPGARGTITYEVTADKGTGDTDSSTVVVGSPKLVAGKLPDSKGLKTGDTVDLPIAVRNDGDLPVERIELRLTGVPGLTFANRPKNCWFDEEYDGRPEAHCMVDATVEPGASAKLGNPLTVKVTEKALATWVDFSAEAVPAGTKDPLGGKRGTDAPLAFGPSAGGEFETKAESTVRLDADHHADFAARGGVIEPVKREPATGVLRFGLDNHGPAAAYRRDGKPLLYADVTLPKGVTGAWNELDEEPDDDTNGACLTYVAEGRTKPFEPGHSRYLCPEASNELPGGGQSYVLGVKIAKGADRKAEGAVKLVPGPAGFDPRDPDADNDTAAITFKDAPDDDSDGASTGGGNGNGDGDGSTAGSDDNGNGDGDETDADGDSGDSSDGSGSSGSSSGSGGSSDSTSGGSDGGSLALTGAGGIGLLAGGAAAALIAGAAAVATTRRRRRTSTT
ncbi:hypothetical protein [Streptomyces sp. XD-27]|uniref:COG1470 family protein n=1 Tax=Streptomyces sp. XD-27 TaxID=3062779 RepID=UPI0026F46B43|nr:hypothetical protein [Streptomyces sp. XD-27]WKX71807.1 hypothetical protein Q3Y56_19585 [Streptomyces sp. XD-27]